MAHDSMENYGHATGPAVISATVLTTVLAAFAILSRLFTRRVVVHNLGLDDFLAVGALVVSILLTVVIGLEVRHGLARHDADLGEDDMRALKMAIWAEMFLYYLGIATIKESILLQYLRIFPQFRFRVVCYTLMAVVFVHGMWSFWSAVFMCRPVGYYWSQSSSGGQCFDRMIVGLINNGVNILTDLAMCILPLPVLQAIAMPKRVKIALMVLFGLGGVVCMMSVLRLGYLYVAIKALDSAWNTAMVSIWSSVGLNIAIMCSCLPTLKACFGRMFPQLKRLLTSRRNRLSNPFGDDDDLDSYSRQTLTVPESAYIKDRLDGSAGTSSSRKRSTDATLREEVDTALTIHELRGDDIAAMHCKAERGSVGYNSSLSPSSFAEKKAENGSAPGWNEIRVVTTVKQEVESKRQVSGPTWPALPRGPASYSSHEWVKNVFNIDAA